MVKEEQQEMAAAPRAPHFFRVLMPGSLEKLSIPRKFSRDNIKVKHKTATLRSCPLGKSWNVKIQGSGIDFYFGEGWQEFAKAHNLGIGFFLVFKYEGSMVFEVMVFDHTTCEKDYTSNTRHASEYSQISTSCTSRRMIVERLKLIASSKKKGAIVAPEEALSALEGESCISLGPNFVAIMKPCHLKRKPYMNIPAEIRESFSLSNKTYVVLRDPEGRSWRVNILHIHRMTRTHSQFGYGWQEFRASNRLKEGDICVFELVADGTVHVHVLRN